MVTADILDYWYSDEMQKYWFASTPVLDTEIRERFEQTWEVAAAGELDDWMESPEGCLALIIILDQFPLNMFRGQAKSFQTEGKAIEVAKKAIEQGFDKQLKKERLAFLFMPLMHSEHLQDQDLSVSMFMQHKLENNIKFAEHHRDIVKKFGRFPHRNEILGRESTEQELAYLGSENAFKG